MALPLELWIDVASPEDTEPLVRHFDGIRHTLITGTNTTWGAGVDCENACAVSVFVEGINWMGCATEQDRIEHEECVLRLYHHLLTAPRFQHAHAARLAHLHSLVEVMTSHASGDDDRSWVADEEVWNRLGRPEYGRPFRPGYRADIALHVESWRKLLGGSDRPELVRIYRELIAGGSGEMPDTGDSE